MHQYGNIAARRFDHSRLDRIVNTCARDHNTSPTLLAAVISVEMLARGAIWRTAERVIGRLLLVLGARARAERLSVGIAQIQPRHLAQGDPVDDRIKHLLKTHGGVDHCARLLSQSCQETGLSESPPVMWSSDDWSKVATTYGGDPHYGPVLQAAFNELARASPPLPQSRAESSSDTNIRSVLRLVYGRCMAKSTRNSDKRWTPTERKELRSSDARRTESARKRHARARR